MEQKKLEAAIEAILFTMGKAVDVGRIARAIDQDTDATEQLLHDMMQRYQAAGYDDIVPISAAKGDGVEELKQLLISSGSIGCFLIHPNARKALVSNIRCLTALRPHTFDTAHRSL